MKGVDVVYGSYINEFILGKKRVMIQPGATKTLEGDPVFDPNDVVFYVLPEDIKDGTIIDAIEMSIQTQDHNTGLRDMLNMLSSKCGFGENHYRFDSGGVSTATQVISENSTLFRTIKKHEIVLESALEELARIILRMGNSVLHMGLDEDVEISIDFDDSIIEDTRTELQDMRADVAKKYGVSEGEARKMLPDMDDLADEEQDEVE